MEKCPRSYKINNKIVEELVNTHFVENYVRKRCINKPCIEDIIQDTYLSLLEYENLSKIYDEQGINGVRRYAAGIIFRSVSDKGTAYRRYFRPFMEVQNWGEVDDERRDMEII
jgi:hypothetical protein